MKPVVEVHLPPTSHIKLSLTNTIGTEFASVRLKGNLLHFESESNSH